MSQWATYYTDDGKAYYHNASTNTTQWNLPDELAEVASNHEEVYTPDLKDLDLNFSAAPVGAQTSSKQEFASPVGRLDNSSGGVKSATASLSKAPDGEKSASPTTWYNKIFSCVRLEDLQQYFDLSTTEFLDRLMQAANPMKKGSADLSERPDFYGPFWIVTTAVIFLSGTANFGNILIADDGAVVITDWNLVYISATMVYGALMFVPLLVSFVLKFWGQEAGIGDKSKLSIAQFICVWGYSFTWLIPCSILCVIPSDIVKWIVVGVAMFISCIFVRNNLWHDMASDLPKVRYVLILLLFGSHAAIYVIFRLYYFGHIHASPEVVAALAAEKSHAAALEAAGAAAAAASAPEGSAAAVETVGSGGRMLMEYLLSH